MPNPCASPLGKFPSQNAAAKAHGVPCQTVHYHLENYGHLNRLGKGTQGRAAPQEIDGISYPSKAAIARAMGVSYHAVTQAARAGRLHEIKRRTP
jgi:hypothetical protein